MADGFKLDMDELEGFLNKIQARVANPSPMMTDIGELLVSSTKERMAKGDSPDGSAMKPVTRGGIPLVNTGVNLMKSITYSACVSDVTVGTNFVGAALHHFGGDIEPKNGDALVFTPKGSKHPVIRKKITIPARPYLGISEDDKEEIAYTIGKYLKGEQ